MTIRIIARSDDANMAAHVGGASACVEFVSFDVECPELEAYLSAAKTYDQRYIVGVEIRKETSAVVATERSDG